MERTFILRKFNENLVKNVMKACSRSSYLSLKQMTGAVDNSGVMVALPIGRERIWHDNTWGPPRGFREQGNMTIYF